MKNILFLLMFLFIFENKIRKKKSTREKLKGMFKRMRKLMIPGIPPPLATSQTLVGVSSNPQVNAPRMLIKNFSEPSEDTYQYPQEHLVTQPQPPPLSILLPTTNPARPHQVYDRQLNSSLENFIENLNPIESKNARNLLGLKSKRNLTVTPMMNLGPGYMDIGSNGYSPLNFALSNPALASMSPFVPRSGPPPPVRIQIKDSLAETFYNKFLTSSQRKLKDKDIEGLKEEIQQEFAALKEQVRGSSSNLIEYNNRIEQSLTKLEEHNLNIKKEVEDMKTEIQNKNAAVLKQLVQTGGEGESIRLL